MPTSDLAALRSAVSTVQDLPVELPEYLSEEQARSIKAEFAKRDAQVADLEKIVTAAADEKREFTVDEAESRGRLLAAIERSDDAVRKIEADAKEAHKEAKAAEARNSLGLGNVGPNSYGGAIKVNLEHRTYERGNGSSYVRDLISLGFGPAALHGRYFEALERMQRHSQENHVEALEAEGKGSLRTKEQEYFLRQMVEARNPRESRRNQGAGVGQLTSYRALSTNNGAGGEFVPPAFLTNMWLALARAGRVIADACHKEPLPDGTMTINIPKVMSGTSVATQGTQNTNIANTDLTTAFVTANVFTKAGAQTVSLQELDRSPIEFDEVILGDLTLAMAQSIDFAVAYGSGVNDVTGILNTSGINTVTWTQGSPTVKGLYGQIEQAKVDIANTRFLPPTHSFMTPTRWGWIEQTFDSNNRPLVVPADNGAWNVLQVADPQAEVQGLTGSRLLGLDLYQDPNIPSNLGTGANQDVVIVSRMDDNWLMESPVTTRALPQTYGAQLSVLFQIYEYMAFTAARYPTANSVLVGTGLTPPVYNS